MLECCLLTTSVFSDDGMRCQVIHYFTCYIYTWTQAKMQYIPLNIFTGLLYVFVLCLWYPILTHWGRVAHICVSKLIIIGSDNGLSPGRRQAIIWTNARILLIGPLRTNFSEILIVIETFSFKKIYLKMSSGKSGPFFLGLNVLTRFGDNCLHKDLMKYTAYTIVSWHNHKQWLMTHISY